MGLDEGPTSTLSPSILILEICLFDIWLALIYMSMFHTYYWANHVSHWSAYLAIQVRSLLPYFQNSFNTYVIVNYVFVWCHVWCTLDYPWVLRDVRAFAIRKTPLGQRGSACVEVMTTLHGNTLSLRRGVEGCVPLEGTIAYAKDPLTHPFYFIEPPSPCWLSLGLIRISFLHVGASVDLLSCLLVIVGFNYPLHDLLSMCSEIGTLWLVCFRLFRTFCV